MLTKKDIRDTKKRLVADAKTYINSLNPIKSEEYNEAAEEILAQLNNIIELRYDPISMCKSVVINETIPNCLFNSLFHRRLQNNNTKYSAIKCRRRDSIADYKITTT